MAVLRNDGSDFGRIFMSQEMMFFERLIGLVGSVWLPVTMLAGLLLALIFRPNTIHNLFLFRTACLLLALSVIVGPVLHLLLMAANFPGGFQNYGSNQIGLPFLSACINALGPILQGVSILCGLFSLIPPMVPHGQVPGPVKHPLD
jgi:hypothetical protein